MTIPKSAKLRREEQAKKEPAISAMLPVPRSAAQDAHPHMPLYIKPIQCCNEFVALLRSVLPTTMELPTEAKLLNEGIVIGTGPGVPNMGDRTPSQVKLGDRVMFAGAPVGTINSDSGFWEGQTIAIISERNLLCVLPKSREFVIVEEESK